MPERAEPRKRSSSRMCARLSRVRTPSVSGWHAHVFVGMSASAGGIPGHAHEDVGMPPRPFVLGFPRSGQWRAVSAGGSARAVLAAATAGSAADLFDPAPLKLVEAADLVDALQLGFDAVALRRPHEVHELRGRPLADQEARQGDALGVIKAPVTAVGIVHGHEVGQPEELLLRHRLGQVGGAEVLLGARFGEHGHALVGPAGDLLVGEQVRQDDVRDLVRQDGGEQVGMIGPHVDPPRRHPAAIDRHGREPGASGGWPVRSWKTAAVGYRYSSHRGDQV